MCVVHLFYKSVHVWFDATHVFCFCTRVSHVCDTRLPFKLWVICTVIGAFQNSLHEMNNCQMPT